MVTNLYEYYSGQGKTLPKTSAERFADPAFATAAKSAGYTPETYQVNMQNADANTKILGYLNKTGTTGVPTTLSNVSVMEKIPSIVDKANKLTDTGIRTDANTGVATYANGNAYDPNQDIGKTTEADTSKEDTAIQKNLDEIKAGTDAATASLIANIQQKFAQRRTEQKDINERQKKAYQTSLLMGGVTGQGSSSQFAPISSEGIIGAQESYGIKQLAALDAEEQDLIAQAKYAQQTQNFKLLEAKNSQLEKKREEKIELAKELNKSILEENKKIREKNMQSSRDDAVADLYSKGITDPSQMLDYLNYDEKGKKIGNFTLKEVKDGLEAVSNKTEINKVLEEAAKNGADAATLQKISSSKNFTEALTSAGQFMSSPNNEILKIGEAAFLIDKRTGKVIKSFGGGVGTGTGVGTGSSPYAGMVNTILASGKFTKEQSVQIKTAIESGEDPFTVIKNNAKNIMGQTLATDLDKAETAKNQLQNIDSLLKDYYANGGKTGLFKGNYEKALNNLGKVNDPKLVGIATEIALAMQAYRLAVTGTAASVQEDARIDNVFPGITNGEILNNARTKATIKSFEQKIDSSYRNTLGPAYDKLKETENGTKIEKGALGDKEYVEKVFKTTGQKYDTIVNATPNGQIPVIDNTTGQIGYIPFTEFSSDKYTKI